MTKRMIEIDGDTARMLITALIDYRVSVTQHRAEARERGHKIDARGWMMRTARIDAFVKVLREG